VKRRKKHVFFFGRVAEGAMFSMFVFYIGSTNNNNKKKKER